MLSLNRPVVNFKPDWRKESKSGIIVTPPAIPAVDRYLADIVIGVTLPPDLHKLLIVSAQQMNAASCLNVLMNGLQVHVDRTDGNPTLLAALKIAEADLRCWKVAFAWCLRDYLKNPQVNSEPFNRKDYRALQSRGEYVYAKFELIESLFKAFDQIDIPNPWLNTWTEAFTMAMFEEVNRSVQTQHTSEDKAIVATRKNIAALDQKRNPYPNSSEWRVNHDLFAAIQTLIVRQKTDNNSVKKARSAVDEKYKAFIKRMKKWTKNIEIDEHKAFSYAFVDEKNGQVYVTQRREKGRPGRKRMTDIPGDKKYL